MNVKDVTVAWLQQQKWQLQQPNKVSIAGLLLKELEPKVDGRGDVIELWSEKWLGEGVIRPAHVYQSGTDYGVIKCWHLHELHTDQFTVTRGKLQVSVVDVRENSPSFGHVNTIFMGIERPRYLQIPPGLMHGWKALSMPETLVVNLQSHVYDPQDEIKFPWDCVLSEVWQPKNG